MNSNSPEMNFSKIAFTHYPARDLERTQAFYRDILGLKVLHHTDEWLEFELGDQRLAFQKTDSTDEPTPSGGAVVWLETSDIKKTVESLKVEGVRFIDAIQEHPYGKLIRFLDSEENTLGLYQPPGKRPERF